MTEIFEQLSTLSIEELQQVIAKSQQLIEEKEQMALRLAQLEKERLEKERLEKERKRQEEIAELQRRLRELQGEDSLISDEQPKAEETVPVTPVQPKVEENVQSVPVQPQETVYSMIPCPNCHQMIPSDSKFCHFCGTSMETQPVPPVQPVQPAQPAYEASGSVVDYDSVRYMDESVKKWADLAGEGEMFSWRDIKMTSPEEAKKLACYIKITTQRILISSESLMKARARTTAFGAIGNLVVEEKGTPWIWIPLNAVRCYRMLDKKEMLIEADRIYTFHSSKAKDIYATLQQLIPDRAR